MRTRLMFPLATNRETWLLILVDAAYWYMYRHHLIISIACQEEISHVSSHVCM